MGKGLRFLGLVLGMLMALGSISNARPLFAPGNDNFPGTSLAGSPVTTTGTNVAATVEAGEPNPAGTSGTASVWWTWTPSASGRYGIDTAGSGYDTTLGVYTGSAVNALAPVAQNDDDPRLTGFNSLVSFDATAGTPYRILVNGFLGAAGTATGAISLNIVGPVTATVAWGPNPPPATVVGATNFTVDWTVSAATNYTDLLIDSFNPPDLSTGGVAQNGAMPATYSEPLTAPPFAGVWYFQAHAIIGGVDFYSPVFPVTVTAPPPPANDNFPGIALTGPSVSTTGSNIGGTAQTGEPDPAGASGTPSVWWAWACPATGTATISLAGSNYDTTLGVYTGNDVAGLTLVAENDDGPTDSTSVVSFPCFAGVTYMIQVNGFAGSVGSISLSISGPAAPAPKGGGGGHGGGGCGLLGFDGILLLGLVGRVVRRRRVR